MQEEWFASQLGRKGLRALGKNRTLRKDSDHTVKKDIFSADFIAR